MQTIDQRDANVKHLVVYFAYLVVIVGAYASSGLNTFGSEIENGHKSFC